jgi:hypothetical protein
MAPLPSPLNFWYGYAPSLLEFISMGVFAFWWLLAICVAAIALLMVFGLIYAFMYFVK